MVKIFQIILPVFIASITNKSQFSASMITDAMQLVISDELSANTMSSDLTKTILQSGWIVTAVTHGQPRCVNCFSGFDITRPTTSLTSELKKECPAANSNFPNLIPFHNLVPQDLSLGKTLTAAGHVPRLKFSARRGVGKVSNYINMLPVEYSLKTYILRIIKFKILANFCLFSLL